MNTCRALRLSERKRRKKRKFLSAWKVDLKGQLSFLHRIHLRSSTYRGWDRVKQALIVKNESNSWSIDSKFKNKLWETLLAQSSEFVRSESEILTTRQVWTVFFNDMAFKGIASYLIRRIQHLYSSFCFVALGNAKKLHVFPSDVWLHFGAKQ